MVNFLLNSNSDFLQHKGWCYTRLPNVLSNSEQTQLLFLCVCASVLLGVCVSLCVCLCVYFILVFSTAQFEGESGVKKVTPCTVWIYWCHRHRTWDVNTLSLLSDGGHINKDKLLCKRLYAIMSRPRKKTNMTTKQQTKKYFFFFFIFTNQYL